MGGNDQPFIYPANSPASGRRGAAYPYSTYNPRASTQASYQALQNDNSPKPQRNWAALTFDKPTGSYMVVSDSGEKIDYAPEAYDQLQAKKRTTPNPDGKLINFNQHPDSWMIVSEQKTPYTPMPPNTKKKLAILRWIQFAHRIMVLLAAIGLLVCLICFTNMPNVFAWVMRIAAAWDIIITFYAIVHLARPAAARTAASSASYHTFALIMDFCFLPFYTIMCFTARNNYGERIGSKERWGSLLKNPDVTTDLIWATFLGAAAISGMHLICCIFDLWLVIKFKQLARLPPDVNPLEDNLTARPTRSSKHKYKNSEVTLTDILSKEKDPGYLSGSTLSVDRQSRLSVGSKGELEIYTSPVSKKNISAPVHRKPVPSYDSVPADDKFDEIDLRKRSESASNVPNYANAASSLFSRALANHATFLQSREPVSPVLEQPEPETPLDPPTVSGTTVADSARDASPAVPNAASPPAKVTSQQQSGLLNENWQSYEEDEEASTFGIPSRQRTPAFDVPSCQQTPARFENAKSKYDDDHLLVPQPLKMNPPTPPPPAKEEYPDPEDDAPVSPEVRTRSALSDRRDNGNGAPSYQFNTPKKTAIVSAMELENEPIEKDDVRSSTPKRKYYGDLAAATRGVLGSKKGRSTKQVDRVTSNETWKSNGTVDAAALDGTGFSALSGYGYGTRRQKKDRVISRTGVDITDSQTVWSSEGGFGLRGRRDVSGKVAEEGRGGTWWSRGA